MDFELFAELNSDADETTDVELRKMAKVKQFGTKRHLHDRRNGFGW